MNELNNLIEVLQGVREGRKWQYRFRNQEWETPVGQGINALATMLRQNYCEIRLVPLPDEIEFNGVMIPAPLRVAPAVGTIVWYPAPWKESYTQSVVYYSHDPECQQQLKRGQYHLTAEAAAKHGKAMCLVAS